MPNIPVSTHHTAAGTDGQQFFVFGGANTCMAMALLSRRSRSHDACPGSDHHYQAMRREDMILT